MNKLGLFEHISTKNSADDNKDDKNQQNKKETAVRLHMFRSYYTLVNKFNNISVSCSPECIDEYFRDVGDRNHYARFIDYIISLVNLSPDKSRFLTIGRKLACNFDLINKAVGLKKGNIMLVELDKETKDKMESEEKLYVEDRIPVDKTKRTRIYHRTNEAFKTIARNLNISQKDVMISDALPKKRFLLSHRNKYRFTKKVFNIYHCANARKVEEIFKVCFDVMVDNSKLFKSILNSDFLENGKTDNLVLNNNNNNNNGHVENNSQVRSYRSVFLSKIISKESTRRRKLKKESFHPDPNHDLYWKELLNAQFSQGFSDFNNHVAQVYLNSLRFLNGGQLLTKEDFNIIDDDDDDDDDK